MEVFMFKKLSIYTIFYFLVALMTSCSARNIDVKTPDYSSLPDGTYRGYFDGGMVKATVDVHMAGGRIEKVTIVSHKCGLGKPAEVIVNDIVKKQSLELDAVTGATRSSKVILKATEIALKK
jgi:uncharacterized protein with FMN-binding domain